MEMQNKAMRYHYIPIRMAKISEPNAEKALEQQELFSISGGISKCIDTLKDSLIVSY